MLEAGPYGTVTMEVQVSNSPTTWPATSITPPRHPEKMYNHQRREGNDYTLSSYFTTITSTRNGARQKVAAKTWNQVRRKAQSLTSMHIVHDPVKNAYLKTSFLFALSVLVTWIPGSINRISGLINSSGLPYGYNVATAAVLPLQGIWNCVIYFMTSASLVGECWRDIRKK
jgi:hypothetical protein